MSKQESFAKRISMESMFNKQTLDPFVVLKWGKSSGQLTPQETITHAFDLIECAIVAELDACLYAWGRDELGLEDEKIGGILRLMRVLSEAGDVPNIRLVLDDGPVPVGEVVSSAKSNIYAAISAKYEALIVQILHKSGVEDPNIHDELIQKFREQRGCATLWPQPGSAGDQHMRRGETPGAGKGK